VEKRSSVNAVPVAGRLVITGMTVKSVIQAACALQPYELEMTVPARAKEALYVSLVEGATKRQVPMTLNS